MPVEAILFFQIEEKKYSQARFYGFEYILQIWES